MILREQVALAPFTTLGVGGPARYYAEAHSEADIREALRFAEVEGLPIFVLGGGSNLLVSDQGFEGLVLKVSLRGIAKTENGAEVTFRVAAGEDWDSFVGLTVDYECAGIECLSGIPGTVGATPVQNVGAYGQEVSETIREVLALDRRSKALRVFSHEDCRFSYRASIFNTHERDAYIILSVTFVLKSGGKPALRYNDLQKAFDGINSTPSLAQVREAVLAIRYSKGMLVVTGDKDAHSAGSFFKNPVISQSKFAELAEPMRSLGVTLPSYPADEGQRKIPAAWLVERAGFHKGYSRGPVGISTKHTLAIVNHGGATAAEIVSLAEEVRAGVLVKFGIELVPEPVFLGF
jgi:UDP-N-acetylmuramate dehydrogenase